MNPISPATRTRAGHEPASLRGAADTVAALPHLLGFTPQESLVALWIRDGIVALTQRLDLPASWPCDGFADHVIRTAEHARAESVVLVVWADDPGSPDGGRPHACLVDALAQATEGIGITVLDALLTDGTRVWSYRCTDACCPPEGRPVSREVRRRIAHAFGGPTPDARRSDIAAEHARDEDSVARVDPRIEDWEADRRTGIAHAVDVARRAARERWRDAQIDAISGILGGEVCGAGIDAHDGAADIAPEDLARVLVGLTDVRVRDTIVWHLGQEDDEDDVQVQARDRTLAVLSDALRAAPPGYTAPVATVLALARWQAGDGARAVMALERALADDPDYRLAHLAAQSIGSGLPPRAWREVVQAMSRAQCRMPEDPGARDVDPWV